MSPCAPPCGSSCDMTADSKTPLAWWQKTIIYEVYPKSFMDTAGNGTGTLEGVRAKLDYLASLGVGAVWLTPVYASPMKDNGYDVVDYRAIDPRFGTMADMERLIAEARRRGIRVVMDLVFNHTSDECPWFQESRASRTNAKADWYIWRDPRPDGSAPTNWRSIFGGPAWTYDKARGQYYLHTFGSFQPDLNWENPEVRQALFDVTRFWVAKGVGGFRVDAITYVKKPAFEDGVVDGPDGLSDIHAATANTPGILAILREFRAAVRGAGGDDVFMVGEANGVKAHELCHWVGARGVFDMLFEFSHLDVPKGGAEVWPETYGWTLPQLTKCLIDSQNATAEDGWCPVFFENHDQPRSVNQFLLGSPDNKLRTQGAKMLATVLMCLRGTPFIFQGQELGLANVAWPSIDCYDDVSSRDQYQRALQRGLAETDALRCIHAFSRDNARTPMQWDASPHAGFTTGTPWLAVHDDFATCNAAVQDADEDSALNWYRHLSAFRASHEVLQRGDFHALIAEDQQVFAFERALGTARAIIVANFTDTPAAWDVALARGLSSAFSTYKSAISGILRPYEAVLFVQDGGEWLSGPMPCPVRCESRSLKPKDSDEGIPLRCLGVQ